MAHVSFVIRPGKICARERQNVSGIYDTFLALFLALPNYCTNAIVFSWLRSTFFPADLIARKHKTRLFGALENELEEKRLAFDEK